MAIIPARYASTRFPGKPLAHRTGKYLIQHVVERVRLARHVGRIIVATDDARILQAVESFGAEAMMTRADHPNGTSRLAEVVERLAACGLTPESSPDPQPLPDLIVNVQGDEPDIDPGVIDQLIEAMHADPGAPMGTVASPFAEGEDPSNPNIVKIVTTQPCPPRFPSKPCLSGFPSKPCPSGPDGLNAGEPGEPGGPGGPGAPGSVGPALRRAIYFSRSLIPFHRDTPRASSLKPQAFLKHIGLYAYRRDFLLTYIALPPTPLEQAEQLEQLRALEHGYPIAVVQSPVGHHGIDTPEQYEEFVRRHV